jgi:hypothetical protein
MATGQSPLPPWLEQLDKRRNETAIALQGLGAVCAIIAVFLSYRSWDDYAVPILTLFLACAALVGAGLWYGFHDPARYSSGDSVRIAALLLCGLLGLEMFLAAAGCIYVWRETVFGGWDEWQGEKSWRIYVLALIAFSGPMLILLGLILTRTEEHSQPLLRRLYYGCNAVLAGELVLLILLVVNVLGYMFLPRESDWTKSKLYTLTTRSQDIIKGLEKPVRIYAILDSMERGGEVLQLLRNCHSVSDKVQWEVVLRGMQDSRLRELMRRYSVLDSIGLLVVSGTEPQEDFQFIRFDELYQALPGDPRSQRREYSFKGEDALISAINYLDQGKNKPIVYFLQGHGELDISRSIDASRPTQKGDQLRAHLEKANYDVKALRISDVQPADAGERQETVAKEVPEDATAVVIAGPRSALDRQTLDALSRYMNPKDDGKKKGKLVVLLGVIVGPDKQMNRTGLESFLAEYNVTVGNDRILSPDDNNPNSQIVVANPQPSGPNALAHGLRELEMLMTDVRTVKPREDRMPPGVGGNYQPDILLITTGRYVWAETNLDDPRDVWDGYKKSRKLPRVATALPVAVAVSDMSTGVRPSGPHAFMGGEGTPRLVVIGNADFASNLNDPLSRRSPINTQYYSLMTSALAWLREKPSNIGIEGKTRDKYKMNETTNVGRMILVPAVLMLTSIVGLGLGVWVVRRR